ncbi:1-(5-phosphoribosyl)-5-[(5-phosphoribosylamino)methylideneamino]imidazole-4-carboxamide isomerase [Convivina intestini]|uniref:1-(5-phosphoribosyl)-5-[(5-phosphoribosylamino)methylideneamino] imidazole-4-carboxamide isomerase n=1 Tax=Convivina intestini TaxID=1505726 RepID=A0A2U1DCH0_9LACO|nr:1-(5-phosphoribosyl)-5-[(5-phosphoribosylamino)methylideneamino]imidazole-4-carboxamide isomerase [Convivina intestini]PVY85357.1 1-(5-phosphoribosyl)-5-[(5-phosphoribosylamino)methylideneamino] imidazole-4-carboxamide isomerase [Convivina intestini]CAH1852967.1 1-(5-phosphoribosyl)-5-[(5-phosphoribosylamino)methylideneamino] imidazole-4-carboxamide isomerase [Convivina intestini]SDB86007.1 1-(5-phosphoribosyl)-5-[(5-phosphoribosylamino)methylideneamino] imidazole-4-carboxamide isomerase [Leu
MIFPAIDLKNGQSVRLYQGDYQQETIINPDPLAQVAQIQAAGLSHLHLVDLDGAKAGRPINLAIIKKIRAASPLFIELGGGIRTLSQVAQYLNLGINRIILGSIALTNPELVAQCLQEYGPEKIAIGVDGRKGRVATDGWLEKSNQSFSQVVQAMQALGAKHFIVTDISRDGTLTGPNLSFLQALQQEFPTSNIIASGGVANRQDLINLKNIGIQDVIVGRALYDGQLHLTDLKEVE